MTQEGSSFHDPEWRLFSNQDATLEMVKGTQYSHIGGWWVGGKGNPKWRIYLEGLGRGGQPVWYLQPDIIVWWISLIRLRLPERTQGGRLAE